MQRMACLLPTCSVPGDCMTKVKEEKTTPSWSLPSLYYHDDDAKPEMIIIGTCSWASSLSSALKSLLLPTPVRNPRDLLCIITNAYETPMIYYIISLLLLFLNMLPLQDSQIIENCKKVLDAKKKVACEHEHDQIMLWYLLFFLKLVCLHSKWLRMVREVRCHYYRKCIEFA